MNLSSHAARTRPHGSFRPDPQADRDRWAVVGLGAVLVALALLRGALAFVPSMWGWGINLLRFVPAAPGWALWSVAALALIPGASRALLPGFSRAGEFVLRAPIRTALLPALGIAALLWALPDRVWFTGDFIGRNTTAAWGTDFAAAFPENLPLDNFLHSALPRLLARLLGVDVHAGLRLIGALEGAALFLLTMQFVRLAAGGAVEAIAGLAIVVAGGYLTMFTGYAKSASELCLITLLFGIAALRLARKEGGLPLAIVATAAGLALHRAAIILLPMLLVLGVLAWRSELGQGAWRRPMLLAAAASLAGVLVFTGPRIVAIVSGFDLSHHFASPEIAARGGLIPSMFAGLRALDLVNATLVLSPLAAAIPILALLRENHSARARELQALAGLALCHAGATLFIHPQQGLFRDWDVMAATGVTLSMLAAWLVMDRLRGSPRSSWLGVATTLAVVTMTGEWLLHESRVAEGLRRARAFTEESPRRSDAELGHVWLYVGDRNAQLQDWAASARALARAAQYQPSSSVFVHWGVSAMQATDAEGARAAWQGMTVRWPADPMGWRELALIDLGLGNHEEALAAARALVRLAPEDTSATALLHRAEAAAEAPTR
jgi:tetratricopeptide (TPR) repeat protein